MVVEDDPFHRRLAVSLLRELGVEDPVEAENGKVALDRLREGPRWQVVLSDVDMPELDGVELLRELAINGLAEAVVITSSLSPAMTAAVSTMADAYGVRVLDIIPKPVTRERLASVLHSYAEADPARAASPGSRPTPETLQRDLDAGAFTAHYQPTVDLATGAVTSVEMLARHVPANGADPMRPATFIPALEQAGLLPGLTHRNLQRASEATVKWQARGLDLAVAVNVSLTELVSVEIADEWEALVLEAGASPGSMTLEITETSVIGDLAVALDVLTRLRLKGFGLSIDDFGTGHSTLDQLRTIPFSELKIDRSFVAGATWDERRRTMLENTLHLTQRLDLRSVAEGVETREEWDLVVDLGCDVAQGWFISQALPAGAVPGWVAEWRGVRP